MARNLHDVEGGEVIKVNVSGFIVEARVVNNCPEEKKMHLIMLFAGGGTLESVEEYKSHTFVNFKVLNPEKRGLVRKDVPFPVSGN